MFRDSLKINPQMEMEDYSNMSLNKQKVVCFLNMITLIAQITNMQCTIHIHISSSTKVNNSINKIHTHNTSFLSYPEKIRHNKYL